MRHMRPTSPLALVLALAVLAGIPALALAVPPDGPPGQGKNKVPKVEVTLEGTVASSTDAKGRAAYTLIVGDEVYELSAGPRWYWRDDHPLAAFVGETVSVVGRSAAGSTEVDVLRINDTEIRAAGRPPWAGGWKVMGSLHPGWSEEKAARWQLKFGECFPPGHCVGQPSEAP